MLGTQPWTASCGLATRRTTSAIDSTTARNSAVSTPTVSTSTVVTSAMTTSERLARRSVRQALASMMPTEAKMMIAASTAVGRYWMGPVRNSRITPTASALTRPPTWLVTCMSSLTAVRDPLAPIGIPALNPAAMFDVPKASSSWSASTVSLFLAAIAREIRMASEKLTRKMPIAGTISDCTSASPTAGMARCGRPGGTAPTSATPCALRSQYQETAIPSTTTMSADGQRGRMRRMRASTTIAPSPSASVARLMAERLVDVAEQLLQGVAALGRDAR